MIPLNIQIKSIIYSFLYGVFFSFLLNLNYKFIYYSKGVIKIIVNLLFILDNTLLYFIILRYVNNGILHYYFIISLFLGFLCVNKVSSKIFKHWFLFRIYDII